MSSVMIEVTGGHSAAVDDATSALLAELAGAGITVTPARASGGRDGGIIALVITIAGGAASIAQVVATIHSMSKRNNVQVVVVDRSGDRTPVDPTDEPLKLQALIRKIGADT